MKCVALSTFRIEKYHSQLDPLGWPHGDCVPLAAYLLVQDSETTRNADIKRGMHRECRQSISYRHRLISADPHLATRVHCRHHGSHGARPRKRQLKGTPGFSKISGLCTFSPCNAENQSLFRRAQEFKLGSASGHTRRAQVPHNLSLLIG